MIILKDGKVVKADKDCTELQPCHYLFKWTRVQILTSSERLWPSENGTKKQKWNMVHVINQDFLNSLGCKRHVWCRLLSESPSQRGKVASSATSQYRMTQLKWQPQRQNLDQSLKNQAKPQPHRYDSLDFTQVGLWYLLGFNPDETWRTDNWVLSK